MKEIDVVIFEDDIINGFNPVIQTSAVWDLRCGAYSSAERISRLGWKKAPGLHVRKRLEPLYREDEQLAGRINPRITASEILGLNGRVLFSASDIQRLTVEDGETLYLSGDDLVAFRVSGSHEIVSTIADGKLISKDSFTKLKTSKLDAEIVRYPWELLKLTGKLISSDLTLADDFSQPTSLPSDVIVRGWNTTEISSDANLGPGVIINAENSVVRIERDVKIGPGVILDAQSGPVWVARNATVEAGAILMGPVFVGPISIIRAGARISNGTSLAEHCRVGGEVSGTVMQSYSNKQHSGYLGNAFIGRWVNLGAATDNSDLKNNYRPVVVSIDGKTIDTGDLHVGAIIGDFCRSAIHTRLNTGTVVNICCNLFGVDFPAKEIPAFTWCGSDGYQEYRFDKAIETIRTIMPRRGKQLSPALESVLRDVFTDSAGKRQQFLEEKHGV